MLIILVKRKVFRNNSWKIGYINRIFAMLIILVKRKVVVYILIQEQHKATRYQQ